MNVKRARVALLETRRCRTLRPLVEFFRVFSVRTVVVNSIVVIFGFFSCCVLNFLDFLDWHDFDFLLRAVLNPVHPLGNILRQSTAVFVHCSPAFVRIIDVLILVNHGMEAVSFAAVVGEVEMSFFYEVRVF